MTAIAANVCAVRVRIARAAERSGRSMEDITLVAATKSVDVPAVREAAAAGVSHFGENRVLEARAKVDALRDLRVVWHLIGHLQRNKVKTALGIFDIIHSVDSLRLAEQISRCAEGDAAVLLQVNVSGEATKGGFPLSQAAKAAERIAGLPHLELRGLTTIAPITEDAEAARPFFRRLRRLAESLGLCELSMGMTSDFEVAVEEGATMVRIGRAIFGERR
ncbi:MAG: YggS family pyridoxal phosphate-dependent enzyme [Chloroflexi bacterium]|nr:YggS family pyridoxal phosphate-dependent enzyme [Chloroflexota bacterium]